MTQSREAVYLRKIASECDVAFELYHSYSYIYVMYNSCNMGTRDLPDMYAQSPRAAGPRAEGIRIRQITSAHVTTTVYAEIFMALNFRCTVC